MHLIPPVSDVPTSQHPIRRWRERGPRDVCLRASFAPITGHGARLRVVGLITVSDLVQECRVVRGRPRYAGREHSDDIAYATRGGRGDVSSALARCKIR